MRLTLSLHDYIDKYLDIAEMNQSWCPLCYADEMTEDKMSNMRHLINCYTDLVVEVQLRKYHDKHGAYPTNIKRLSAHCDDIVKQEMLRYHLKYAAPHSQV